MAPRKYYRTRKKNENRSDDFRDIWLMNKKINPWPWCAHTNIAKQQGKAFRRISGYMVDEQKNIPMALVSIY